MYSDSELGLRNQAMQCNSLHKGFNKSPLDGGASHVGVDGIKVRLINWPNESMFKRVLAKMVMATTGSDVDRELDGAVGEEMFRGGLQTGLEAGVLSFEISGCSRALTHELVRTRQAVFHQQSMRHTDMGDMFNVREPLTIARSAEQLPLQCMPRMRALFEDRVESAAPHDLWVTAVGVVRETYAAFKRADLPYQDCRNICPIGTETYIIATYPIKVFLDTYAYRACSMFMWEMVWVMRRMGDLVREKFQWMAPYLRISCEKSQKCMFQGYEPVEEQCDGGGTGERFEWATRAARVYDPNMDLIAGKDTKQR